MHMSLRSVILSCFWFAFETMSRTVPTLGTPTLGTQLRESTSGLHRNQAGQPTIEMD